jgi:hypothetical protein
MSDVIPFKQTVIWTDTARTLLYQRLLQRFGSYATWKNVSSPGAEFDDAFDEFCENFARVIGAKSGGAVKHQIRFALPETERGSTFGRHAQNAILNKAAALRAGFVEDKHLPDLLAVKRSPKSSNAATFSSSAIDQLINGERYRRHTVQTEAPQAPSPDDGPADHMIAPADQVAIVDKAIGQRRDAASIKKLFADWHCLVGQRRDAASIKKLVADWHRLVTGH